MGSKGGFSVPQYEAMFDFSALRTGGYTSPSHTHPIGLPRWPVSPGFLPFPLKIFEPDKNLYATNGNRMHARTKC